MPYKDPVKRREVSNRISREWAKKNPEKMKQFQREYYERNRDKRRASHKNWLSRNPEYMREWSAANKKSFAFYSEKYAINNPEKHKAHYSLNNALRSGKMTKPSHCSTCGEKRKLQGHHFMGYDKKYWFTVIWLCIPCHKKIHH